jgi:hypothetical protein
MNIRRLPVISKKTVLISAASVIGVALIGVGGWSFAAIQAETSFAQGFVSTKQAIKSDLESVKQSIKSSITKADTAVTSKALKDSADMLLANLDTLPQPWEVLGISLVGQNRLDDKQALVSKVGALSDALKSGAEVLAYENQVLEPLLKVKSLTGRDLESQKTLAANWLTLLNQLKALSPPDIATAVHAGIIKEVSAIQTTLAALPALYEKKDEAGFKAKTTELQATIAQLQALQDVVQKLNAATDKSIGETYQSLDQAIQ